LFDLCIACLLQGLLEVILGGGELFGGGGGIPASGQLRCRRQFHSATQRWIVCDREKAVE
jgi:hypothetical protein